MDPREFSVVRQEVYSVATLRDSYDHGDRHWRAVAHAGLGLAFGLDGCDAVAVLLFALLHDSMRLNEFDDPDHGARGATLAREILGGRIDARRLDLVDEACRNHTHVERTTDPTVGACWDADRLDLWRVGKTPDPRFLSTELARDGRTIDEARGYHKSDLSWDDLASRACALEVETFHR